MKVLHVTPHLGGGVGKAHAALAPALPEVVRQTYVLLEPPRERRHVDALEKAGARVVVAGRLEEVATLAHEADIVQFEFWNHPRLFECLARCDFPAMRTVIWSHVSGLFRPLIQPGLIAAAGRFVFSTEASLSIPGLSALPDKRKISVINSGFGFIGRPRRQPVPGRPPAIAYLGTVDFIKMHPGFFEAIDRLIGGDIQVAVWGAASEAVAECVREMRHPDRVRLCGETDDPAAALGEADIFFYPLRPDHYGTAENALVEAMSLGLTPVVLGNPAERAIVRDSETGFIARDIAECASLLQMLLLLPELRDKISQNATRYVSENLTSAQAAMDFMVLWLGLLAEPAKQYDFRAAIGDSPAEWFAATQRLPDAAWMPPAGLSGERPAKGTLAHFESVFADDESLTRLRRGAPAKAKPASKPARKRA